MTEADAAEGWGAAPPGLSWRCPDCNTLSPITAWQEAEVYCEDCGTHEARRCPRCEETFDCVWGDAQIAEATGPDNLTPATPNPEPGDNP